MLNLTKCKIALSNLNWTELYEYISGVYGLLAACAAMWQSERYISRVYCTVCALARVCRHVAVRAIYQPRVLYCMCSGPRVPPCGSQSDISAACIVLYVLWPACAAMWQWERYISHLYFTVCALARVFRHVAVRAISRVYCTVCALARVCRHVGVRAIYQPRVLYTVQYVLLAACARVCRHVAVSQSDISAAGYIIIIISYSLIEGGTFQYQHTYYPNTNLTILAA